MNENTTPEEETYLFWFACRVMRLAIDSDRHNLVMRALRVLYARIGRSYYGRSRPEMAEDIRRLGERLAERLAEVETRKDVL